MQPAKRSGLSHKRCRRRRRRRAAAAAPRPPRAAAHGHLLLLLLLLLHRWRLLCSAAPRPQRRSQDAARCGRTCQLELNLVEEVPAGRGGAAARERGGAPESQAHETRTWQISRRRAGPGPRTTIEMAPTTHPRRVALLHVVSTVADRGAGSGRRRRRRRPAAARARSATPHCSSPKAAPCARACPPRHAHNPLLATAPASSRRRRRRRCYSRGGRRRLRRSPASARGGGGLSLEVGSALRERRVPRAPRPRC